MITMSNWRERMVEDMRLHDLRPRIIGGYALAVRLFLERSGKSPEEATEEDVHRYVLHLRDERVQAPSSINIAVCALRSLFVHTLGREYDVFGVGARACSTRALASAGASLAGSLAPVDPKKLLRWTASSGSTLQLANGDQVAVSDCPNVCVAQANEGLGLAARENELDFKTIRRMQVDDGAEITATQTMLGQVPIQDDGVEQVEHS
jgi:hypothetical protein